MRKILFVSLVSIFAIGFFGCAEEQSNEVQDDGQKKNITITVMQNDKEMGKVNLSDFAVADLVDQGAGDSVEKAVPVSKIIAKASGDSSLSGEKLDAYLKDYFCDYEGKDDREPFRPSDKGGAKPTCLPYSCSLSTKIYIGVETGGFYPKEAVTEGCYGIKGMMTHVHVLTKEFWGKGVNE